MSQAPSVANLTLRLQSVAVVYEVNNTRILAANKAFNQPKNANPNIVPKFLSPKRVSKEYKGSYTSDFMMIVG